MRFDKFTTKFQQALSDAQSLAVGTITSSSSRSICSGFAQRCRQRCSLIARARRRKCYAVKGCIEGGGGASGQS